MTHPTTIPELLGELARTDPDGEAVWDGEARTLGALDEAVARTAAGLVAFGVQAGDRVAIWAPNSERWVVLQLAALSAGAVVVPFNTRLTGADVAGLLARAPSALLGVDTGFRGVDLLERLREAGGLAHAGRVVVLDGPVAADAVGWAELDSAGAAAERAEVERRTAALNAGSISHLQFTSGTTGRPKGALLRHGAMVSTTESWVRLAGLTAQDRYVVTSPLFHLSGHKTGVLASLTARAAFSLEPIVDIDRLLGRIATERISVLQGPPTLFRDLLDHPARADHDLSSLRLAVTGAAVVPEALVRRLQTELSFETVLTAYGITETTGVVTMCRPSDPPDVVAATSGRPVPGVELRIEPIDGAEGTEGEILVRGPGVFAAYLDDDAATADAVDADGWYHTGDVGWLDHGNLRITDRLGDLILVGGFNVYPAEVEAALSAHPAVAQVAVVGGPDDRLGEVPVAHVVARPGFELDAGELLAWAQDRLASHKRPRRIEVVEALPLTASGKVRRTELRR
ncbi:MAG: AMP-binding protein [Acidimicrobiales bacterium]|nr:AMP-binding protein [Acidimicrobiales bacterium]